MTWQPSCCVFKFDSWLGSPAPQTEKEKRISTRPISERDSCMCVLFKLAKANEQSERTNFHTETWRPQCPLVQLPETTNPSLVTTSPRIHSIIVTTKQQNLKTGALKRPKTPKRRASVHRRAATVRGGSMMNWRPSVQKRLPVVWKGREENFTTGGKSSSRISQPISAIRCVTLRQTLDLGNFVWTSQTQPDSAPLIADSVVKWTWFLQCFAVVYWV